MGFEASCEALHHEHVVKAIIPLMTAEQSRHESYCEAVKGVIQDFVSMSCVLVSALRFPPLARRTIVTKFVQSNVDKTRRAKTMLVLCSGV